MKMGKIFYLLSEEVGLTVVEVVVDGFTVVDGCSVVVVVVVGGWLGGALVVDG